jgi:putative membrane-bound dehydrogenase-like protein
MKKLLLYCTVAFLAGASLVSAEPLRVFIRAGAKTHGPGKHDWPQFLKDWTQLLSDRGAKATGKQAFPTGEELDNTDVLIIATAEGGTIAPEDRKNLDKFLKRGGGIVTLHDGVCGTDPQWFKTIIGGAWEHGHSKWYEGMVGEYFVDTEHPITRGASNFDFDDEIYYDLHMMPEAHVLATSFHTVFVIGPQMWTYEKDKYRAFTWLAGHTYESFNLPQVRALLLRGISWAGKRSDLDALCTREELGSLKYPSGGPTAPEHAAEKLVVDPEFTVNLVASEPLIEKAISLDWDPQGRLWVAETPEYPNGRTVNKNDAPIATWSSHDADPTVPAVQKVDRPARDRISWLEDTDGDGIADKKHVFADGLELVTSMVFYKDGVIVAQAPDILWLRDTDGDGKCDMKGERVVLYTGFGTFDTHAVINNFRWGMDGWVYGAVGYSAGNPTSGDGSTKFGRITAGVIRFKPDGSAFEQVASGSCNTWGFDFAPGGEAFYTTATCNEHFLHVVMPEKILAKGNIGGVRSSAVIPDHQEVKPLVKHTRPAYVQIDLVGRFTATAGCCIYNGGAWPEKFNGSHFCSEPTVSLVHNEFVKPNGVTYLASKEPGREETEFMPGTDLWFRPIHTRVGPDGALYVIDFYNQAAIHNDTRGPKHGANNAAVRPDRDHHLGRIWRIQHKQAKQLPKASFAEHELVRDLESPNGWVRMTAQRLLIERGDGNFLMALKKLARDESKSDYARIHALWTAYLIWPKHDTDLLGELGSANHPIVQKAVMQLVRNYPLTADEAKRASKLQAAMIDQLDHADPRLRLETLMAVSSAEDAAPFNQALWKQYAALDDSWTESALVSIFARDPEASILAAADLADPVSAKRTVRELANRIAAKQDGNVAAELLVRLADKPAKADALKQIVLDAFNRTLKQDVAANWEGKLATAFRTFLKADESVATAALPLIARWDKDSQLTPELQPVVKPLLGKLGNKDTGDNDRAQIASGLLGIRKLNPEIVPAIITLLSTDESLVLKRRIAEALGSVSDDDVGQKLIDAYPTLAFELRDPVFAQIIKRNDWAQLLISALEQKKIQLTQLGLSLTHRLRTHSDPAVASHATQVIDAIRGPEMKEKDAIIKQLVGTVSEHGNAENGHKIFTQNCATCHRFKGEGRDVAPDLTGMGAHGPGDLLVHIVDPNRVVEPNFLTFSIETKDDLSYDGIVARENRTTLVLRNATQDYEIRQDNIKSRRATGLSLMPNGFEALGGEGLRDLITFISSDEAKYRIVDLARAFTADSTRGMFNSLESTNEAVQLRRFGLVPVEGIPFDVVSPTRSQSGKNLIVLKGRQGIAKDFPQRIEVPVSARANRLNFLGGVGGWAFPCCGDNKNENLPVAKVIVFFKDGATKELTFLNGQEFADYNGKYDVPASKEAPGIARSGQVRWFSKDLGREADITKLTFESFNTPVAPVFVAVTAEIAESKPVAKKAAPGAIRTLIVGGGSSHDFDRWFHEADSATLEKGGLASVDYTEDLATVPSRLKEADVLYLCTNNPMNDENVRKAIWDFANSGKGLVLVHAGLWYSWKNWPEYNAQLVGGGARSHDRYQLFNVTAIKPNHPVLKGVSEKFSLKDELYHSEKDPKGAPIEVLLEASLPDSDKKFASVWITEHPKARIVCIALGHDGASHNLPEYQAILRNAVQWAAGK